MRNWSLGTALLAVSYYPVVACVPDPPDAIAVDGGVADGAQGGTDAGASADSSTSDGPSSSEGDNLLINGDFELDCANWEGVGATLAKDPIAHGGASSCRICATGEVNYAFAVQGVQIATKPGEQYVARMWVRAADGKPYDSNLHLALSSRTTGSDTAEEFTSQLPPLSATWQSASTIAKLTGDGGQELHVEIGPGTTSVDGGCFLLDDATLVRVR